MSSFQPGALYEKIANVISLALTDIDQTGGFFESPALQYMYDSLDGLYAIAYTAVETLKQAEDSSEYEIYRAIEVVNQELQGKTPKHKKMMEWVRKEMFEQDPLAGRVRQKRTASMVKMTNMLKLKMSISPQEPSTESQTRLKILFILGMPIAMLLRETSSYVRSISPGISYLPLITTMLGSLVELRAMAETRAQLKDILMLQIRRGISENFIAHGRSKQVVNDAICAIVNQYQGFSDPDLQRTVEDVLGTKEQMTKYLTL